jgi:hypothetical protein
MARSVLSPIETTTVFRSNAFSWAMNEHLPPDEKLAILQAADIHRKWYSLDDQRVCVLCNRLVTGRQIEITRDSSGAFSLRCPTQGCQSTLSDWFYFGSSASSKAPDQRKAEIDLWEN